MQVQNIVFEPIWIKKTKQAPMLPKETPVEFMNIEILWVMLVS